MHNFSFAKFSHEIDNEVHRKKTQNPEFYTINSKLRMSFEQSHQRHTLKLSFKIKFREIEVMQHAIKKSIIEQHSASEFNITLKTKKED